MDLQVAVHNTLWFDVAELNRTQTALSEGVTRHCAGIKGLAPTERPDIAKIVEGATEWDYLEDGYFTAQVGESAIPAFNNSAILLTFQTVTGAGGA